jgi:hypothetical protein
VLEPPPLGDVADDRPAQLADHLDLVAGADVATGFHARWPLTARDRP